MSGNNEIISPDTVSPDTVIAQPINNPQQPIRQAAIDLSEIIEVDPVVKTQEQQASGAVPDETSGAAEVTGEGEGVVAETQELPKNVQETQTPATMEASTSEDVQIPPKVVAQETKDNSNITLKEKEEIIINFIRHIINKCSFTKDKKELYTKKLDEIIKKKGDREGVREGDREVGNGEKGMRAEEGDIQTQKGRQTQTDADSQPDRQTDTDAQTHPQSTESEREQDVGQAEQQTQEAEEHLLEKQSMINTQEEQREETATKKPGEGELDTFKNENSGVKNNAHNVDEQHSVKQDEDIDILDLNGNEKIEFKNDNEIYINGLFFDLDENNIIILKKLNHNFDENNDKDSNEFYTQGENVDQAFKHLPQNINIANGLKIRKIYYFNSNEDIWFPEKSDRYYKLENTYNITSNQHVSNYLINLLKNQIKTGITKIMIEFGDKEASNGYYHVIDYNSPPSINLGGGIFDMFKKTITGTNTPLAAEDTNKEEDEVANSFYINDEEFSKLFLRIKEIFKDETNKDIISLISEIKDIIKKGNNVENCEEIINYLIKILEILKSTKSTETTETNNLEKKDGSFGLNDGPLSQLGSNNSEKPIDLTNITKNLEKIVIYIYDVILGIIILICIIISIIHIFNILKFLYKCFIEIGSVQHSNLLTKDTFRYKLLEYITYIDNSSLPGLINTYNNPTTGTEQIIKFSNIIKDFYSSSNTPGITQAPPNPTEESIAETTIKTLGEDKLIEIKNNHATLVEENNKKEGNTEMKNWDELSYIEKLQYINEHEPNCAKFINENYNNAKEPIFNIFLCIRLIFICFKFFITFIMILVLSVILYIVTQIVDSQNSSSTDMFNDKTFIQILKASGICFIYLIINIILYKTMFLKIYNKMLDTYLNVICIDILLNQIKKDMTHEHADTPTHTHPEFFNDDFINLIKNKIDDDHEIKKNIQDKIKTIVIPELEEEHKNIQDQDKNYYTKEITGMILIYVLIKHIHNGHNKIKGSTDKVFNYFIKDKNISVIDEYWKTFKYDKSFYGLIPNNYRKVPIPYFKYNWENTSEIPVINKSNEILIEVNNKITQFNQYISDANNNIDDDNYLVNIGWYFLSNLFISSILIILVIYILKDTFTKK